MSPIKIETTTLTLLFFICMISFQIKQRIQKLIIHFTLGIYWRVLSYLIKTRNSEDAVMSSVTPKLKRQPNSRGGSALPGSSSSGPISRGMTGISRNPKERDCGDRRKSVTTRAKRANILANSRQREQSTARLVQTVSSVEWSEVLGVCATHGAGVQRAGHARPHGTAFSSESQYITYIVYST